MCGQYHKKPTMSLYYATFNSNTASHRYVCENGVLYEECNGRYESYDPDQPLFTQWVVDMIPVDGAEIKRPRCEHKGSKPHDAHYVLVWENLSGRHVKFMCKDHYKDIGTQPYWVGKLVGVNY
jgi:hypothetical protein